MPCAAVATVVIVVECWIATEVLGAVLDRTDVGAIDPPAGQGPLASGPDPTRLRDCQSRE